MLKKSTSFFLLPKIDLRLSYTHLSVSRLAPVFEKKNSVNNNFIVSQWVALNLPSFPFFVIYSSHCRTLKYTPIDGPQSCSSAHSVFLAEGGGPSDTSFLGGGTVAAVIGGGGSNRGGRGEDPSFYGLG